MRAKKFLIVPMLLGGCALFATLNVPVKNEGDVLADTQGMTLYVFDRDPLGESICTAQCAMNWPPLYAVADAVPAGDYTLIARDGGRKQWAYKGKPLYLSSRDRKPGDRTGHGVDNMWRIARP